MNMLDNYAKMCALKDELNKYTKSYYVDNVSLISDYEFDMKMKELQKMEEELNFVFPDSPTIKVGSDLSENSGFRNYPHKIQMGSVENCYDYESISAYFNKLWESYCNDPANSANVRFYKQYKNWLIVECKFDGLSCSLHYEYGKLILALTRGDGTTGAVITENAKVIDGIPEYIPQISHVPHMEVRGEVLMPKSTFTRLNAERAQNGEKLLANERNAASGSLKQLDPNVTKSRGLIFIPYNVFSNGDLHISPFGSYNRYSQIEIVHYYLVSLGFKESPYLYCNPDSLSEILELFKLTIWKYQDYCMDGAVVKLNDKLLQDRYGYDKKYPDWCRAMKWKADSTKRQTRLLDVEWSVGKTGKITPTAILEPCEINGSVISRATLNNMDYIKEIDAHIGDMVTVEKAGEVIPQITASEIDVEEYTFDINPPEVCPICGEVLTKKIKQDGEETVNLYCTNKKCPGINKEKLKYYCSKECMDIDTLGDKTIDFLNDRTLLTQWKDVYYLNECDLAVVGGYTVYSAHKLLNAIKDSVSKADPATLLYSIGIDGIGKKTMTKIMDYFKSFKNLIDFWEHEDSFTDLLINEVGIGEVSARAFYEWMKDYGTDAINFYTNYKDIVPEEVYENLPLAFNTSIGEKQKVESGPLSGLVLLATGTLKNYSRDGIRSEIIKNGGTYASGMSKKLNYLIVGESAGPSKLQKAKDMGIRMISESDFVKLIGEENNHYDMVPEIPAEPEKPKSNALF